MRTISTKTAVLTILSFTALCVAVVLLASKLPRTSHWDRYRTAYPEKAIQANLREVVFAATDYMRRHGVSEARYEDLVGASIFLDKPIEPVLGEDYNSICLTNQDTKLEVLTRDGTPVRIDFKPLAVSGIGPLPEPNRPGPKS